MEPPTAQQVQRARADLLSAQQTIAASSELLAAAGISMEMPAHPPLGMEVNAVAVKLPALWPDNPRKWFLHCEAKFRLHSITAQQTMFDHCINVMTAEQSDVVMDLMERGPSPTCYDDLKQAYVERRTPSTAERIQRLRKLGPITDQRPSDLLRLMERILGRSIEGDEIAKEEFVRRLPAQTQLIIRSQADLFTVEQLAQMADRLASVPAMQATSPSFSVTQAEASREDDVVTLASLHQQLARLTTSNDMISAEVAELKRSTPYAGNRRARGGSRSETVASRRSRMYRGLNADGLCWYHLVWGANANKCSEGCRQAGNGRAGR